MKVSGQYDIGSIKYFRAGLVMKFPCPYCGREMEMDTDDGMLEYPKPDQIFSGIECDCGKSVTLRVKISMPVEILYEVQV